MRPLRPPLPAQIPCPNIGLPNHIKVWHDNTGRRPDWFLEWVRIRKKGARNWTVFPCQRWLSTHLDDGRISRVLFAGHATPFIQYKVGAAVCVRLPPLHAPRHVGARTSTYTRCSLVCK